MAKKTTKKETPREPSLKADGLNLRVVPAWGHVVRLDFEIDPKILQTPNFSVCVYHLSHIDQLIKDLTEAKEEIESKRNQPIALIDNLEIRKSSNPVDPKCPFYVLHEKAVLISGLRTFEEAEAWATNWVKKNRAR